MKTSKAFTLPELIIGMGVVATLVAITVPIVSRARENARQAKCTLQEHDWGVYLNSIRDKSLNFPRFTGIPSVAMYNKYKDDTGIELPQNVDGHYERKAPYWCPSSRNQAGVDACLGKSYTYLSPIRGIEDHSVRALLMFDYERPHNGKFNLLYTDGSVRCADWP